MPYNGRTNLLQVPKVGSTATSEYIQMRHSPGQIATSPSQILRVSYVQNFRLIQFGMTFDASFILC
jgi:hypothetical protein